MIFKTVRGFTLIELLVVIAIIGTLASVVLASLNSARDKAKVSAAAAELKEIEKAFILAAIDEGRSSLWTENLLGGGNPTLTTIVAHTNGRIIAEYLPNVPTSELGNGVYAFDNDGDTAVVGGSTYFYQGVNILIRGTTLTERQMLDQVIDDGDGGNRGKITWDPSNSGVTDLLYKIAPSPSSF